jgi:O-antigen/teichoic acid export membrane protein
MIGKYIGLILAKLLSPLTSFLIIVLVARYWGEAVLGAYNTVWVWMVIFQHLSIFGICEFITREAGANKNEADKFFVHGLVLSLLFAFLCIAFMAGGVYYLDYPETVRRSIIIVSLALPFTSIILICHALFTAFQKIVYVAFGGIIENIIFLVAGSAVVYYQLGLVQLIWALVIARAVAAVVNIGLVHNRIAKLLFQFDGEFLRKIIRPVIVFGLTGIAFQIFMRIDVIILSKLKDMAEVGLYSSASKLWEISLMMPLVFYFLSLPVVADGYRNFRTTMHDKMRVHTEKFFLMIFCVFGFGMFFANTILMTIFGEPFGNATLVLRILMIAFLIHCAEITMEMSCQAAGYQNTALKIAVIRALANILLNFLLIPFWGAVGAAFATLISITGSFFLFLYNARKIFGHYPWGRAVLKPALVCAAVIGVLLPFAKHLNTLYVAMLFFVFYGLFLFAAYGFPLDRIKTHCLGR